MVRGGWYTKMTWGRATLKGPKKLAESAKEL
jgi:hypothetical protein